MASTNRAATRPAKVFAIGQNLVGTMYLRQLFEAGGYSVAAWEKGWLAADICYTARTGAAPLADFADRDVFLDLTAYQKVERPPLDGHAEFAHLRRFFPDAYFILNTRPVEDWLGQRWDHANGAFRARQAAYFNVAEHDLPDLWRAEWSRHLDRCRAFFSADARFLELPMDDGAGMRLTAFLKDDYALQPTAGLNRNLPSGHALPKSVDSLAKRKLKSLKHSLARRRRRRAAFSPAFCQQIVDFATRQDPAIPTTLGPEACSQFYAQWDGAAAVTGRDGQPLPIAVNPERAPAVFLRAPHPFFKEYRAEAVLNEIWSLGGRKGARLDFEDARRFGTAQTGALRNPVLGFNRRVAASGLILWPLPAYHTPGQDTYIHDDCRDTIPFADKRDQIVWRGSFSGNVHPDLAPAGAELLNAGKLINGLGKGEDDAMRIAALRTVPRGHMMHKFHGHPDCDIGWVLGGPLPNFSQHPVFGPQVMPTMPVADFYKYRYILSISGIDSGSNFLMALDSNSVVMREEDGWELFFSGQFRPWEHYIPLALGADDLLDKLDWARSHPTECNDMSRAARAVCRRLALRANRHDYLRGILEVYEGRM